MKKPYGRKYLRLKRSIGNEMTLETLTRREWIGIFGLGLANTMNAASTRQTIQQAANYEIGVGPSAARTNEEKTGENDFLSAYIKKLTVQATNATYTDGKLPTKLNGIEALINGEPAHLSYVGPGQINLITGQGTGTAVLQILQNAKQIGQTTINLEERAEKLFHHTGGIGIATDSNGNLITTNNPARPEDIITLYGSGNGIARKLDGTPLQPGQQTPTPTSTKGLYYNNPTTIKIAGQETEVFFNGAAPGFSALTQYNVRVPKNVDLNKPEIQVGDNKYFFPVIQKGDDYVGGRITGPNGGLEGVQISISGIPAKTGIGGNYIVSIPQSETPQQNNPTISISGDDLNTGVQKFYHYIDYPISGGTNFNMIEIPPDHPSGTKTLQILQTRLRKNGSIATGYASNEPVPYQLVGMTPEEEALFEGFEYALDVDGFPKRATRVDYDPVARGSGVRINKKLTFTGKGAEYVILDGMGDGRILTAEININPTSFEGMLKQLILPVAVHEWYHANLDHLTQEEATDSVMLPTLYHSAKEHFRLTGKPDPFTATLAAIAENNVVDFNYLHEGSFTAALAEARAKEAASQPVQQNQILAPIYDNKLFEEHTH